MPADRGELLYGTPTGGQCEFTLSVSPPMEYRRRRTQLSCVHVLDVWCNALAASASQRCRFEAAAGLLAMAPGGERRGGAGWLLPIGCCCAAAIAEALFIVPSRLAASFAVRAAAAFAACVACRRPCRPRASLCKQTAAASCRRCSTDRCAAFLRAVDCKRTVAAVDVARLACVRVRGRCCRGGLIWAI